ncbi:MAG: bifunctional 5,10-methylenetetrahydrofolate dehydrogenase/5,10-methenyltetrahydrofolate cyclohydrolase [Acidobacteriota bacterium]
MCAHLLDGTSLAKQIKSEVAEQVESLLQRGIKPGLAVVLVGDNPASLVYVSSKVKACEALGIYSEKHELSANTTTEQLLTLIGDLNRRDEIDGILVQLPLPPQIDTDVVITAIDPAKDIDGFHPENVGYLALKRPRLVPCTPAGIMEMLKRNNIPIAGRRAVVLGRSRIVGMPMALMLMNADATVTICHSKTNDLGRIAREADILVAAIGRTACVTAEYIKPGAVIIDVGMNQLTVRDDVLRYFPDQPKRLEEFERKGYTLIGDVKPASTLVAGYFTPVPGGVGPLTIAMLMKNTLIAACARRGVRY